MAVVDQCQSTIAAVSRMQQYSLIWAIQQVLTQIIFSAWQLLINIDQSSLLRRNENLKEDIFTQHF